MAAETMLIATILGLITTLLAYIARSEKNRMCLKLAFILIFVFLALRYNFGNDYNGG
jgi:hypothetical protein